MHDCCEIRAIPGRQRRVLVVVLCINALMFVGELGAGLLAHYGFSLYVVAQQPIP